VANNAVGPERRQVMQLDFRQTPAEQQRRQGRMGLTHPKEGFFHREDTKSDHLTVVLDRPVHATCLLLA